MQTSLCLLDELIERLHLDFWVELFLEKDDNMMKYVAIQALVDKIEAKHNEERNVLIQQLAESGIFILLMNHLAVCDVGYVSLRTIESIANIIRIIVESKSKYISIMIERLICFTSNYKAPTLGIMYGLTQLSWTHHRKIREKIINEKMLNYLLYHFTIDSISNDNEALLLIKTSYLWLHIHFELSVKGSFIQKKATQIANILNILINIDHDIENILFKACQSWKKFGKQFPMLISRKSLYRICDLLTSNTMYIVQESLRCLNGIICQLHIDSFMKKNVLQKISDHPSAMFKDSEISRISCELIGNLLLFSQSEYVVHCIIKHNLIKPIMNVIESEKFKRSALEIIWDILNFGNEQHIYFMIINENIMHYLCDQRLYKELKDVNTDNVVLSVFAKLLFYGDKIKKMNHDKNIIALLMKKYNGFELIQHIISKNMEIRDDDNRLLLSYYDKIKDQDIDYDDNVSLYDLEMIIIYFNRKYCEIDNNPLQIIPKSLQNMIKKFAFIECNLSVSYLQMELDVNNLVFLNRNKQCNYCENIKINIQRCSGCKYIFYCNKQCQRKHWKLHKPLCLQITNYIAE